ncbi:MAG: hypothetical protein QXR20_05445, partial [Candidatus Caldarchaeum sp.]
AFGFREGVLEPGRPADLVVMDAPYGSVARDAVEAFSVGDIPGIAMVMIDGVVRVGRSRMTPPPSKQIKTSGEAKMPEGGH